MIPESGLSLDMYLYHNNFTCFSNDQYKKKWIVWVFGVVYSDEWDIEYAYPALNLKNSGVFGWKKKVDAWWFGGISSASAFAHMWEW